MYWPTDDLLDSPEVYINQSTTVSEAECKLIAGLLSGLYIYMGGEPVARKQWPFLLWLEARQTRALLRWEIDALDPLRDHGAPLTVRLTARSLETGQRAWHSILTNLAQIDALPQVMTDALVRSLSFFFVTLVTLMHTLLWALYWWTWEK
jgi:hypothetical protein